MTLPFALLILQTLALWSLVVLFHRGKTSWTLIPLYAYIAVLTIFTHNLSDLQFAIVSGQWYFLISSFSFFTTLMFGVLFLYLFEGPRAGRIALWEILITSFFYIVLVYLLGQETNTAGWVILDRTRALYYFWSLFAIVLDVVVLAIGWELLSRAKSLYLVFRVFIISFVVFALDTLVFTTGAFGNSNVYASLIQGNLIIRLLLSIVSAPIISYFLSIEGFDEEKREKPKRFWEILNFRSDLEIKITGLEAALSNQRILQEQLKKSEEAYEMALSGSGAGIWSRDITSDKVSGSARFYKLLGYSPEEMNTTFKELSERMLHPDDVASTMQKLSDSLNSHEPFDIEARIKTKSGEYRWFWVTGIAKYDENNKPTKIVGSIIDTTDKKMRSFL